VHGHESLFLSHGMGPGGIVISSENPIPPIASNAPLLSRAESARLMGNPFGAGSPPASPIVPAPARQSVAPYTPLGHLLSPPEGTPPNQDDRGPTRRPTRATVGAYTLVMSDRMFRADVPSEKRT
jgi:hypothetical protein